jgi:hypothetical protein
MFSNAYEIAQQYTSPFVASSRTFDKQVHCGGGAFIILNNEGWILTVAHIFELYAKLNTDNQHLMKYYQNVEEIENNPALTSHLKKKKIGKLNKDPKWITNISFWLGRDELKIDDLILYPELDFAIARLEPFNPETVTKYPKIINPTDLKPGTSLCKLGFPFHEITANFDEDKNRFEFSPNSLPLPLFPIEGILTRFLIGGKTFDGKYNIKFIETSSPGLRGQSGGPIFDINATICGIQSHTTHLPLGFSPKVKTNGKEVEENQFINVGCGVHPELIIDILTEKGIKFDLFKK